MEPAAPLAAGRRRLLAAPWRVSDWTSWAPGSRRLFHLTVLTKALPVVSSDSIIACSPRASAITRTMRVRQRGSAPTGGHSGSPPACNAVVSFPEG